MRQIAQLPGPKPLPLLGNLHQLHPKKLHRTLAHWREEFGPIYRFQIANKPFVVVGELESISTILKNRPDTYRRMGAIESVSKEIGTNGIFSAEGETWRRHRKMVMPAFNVEHLRHFFGSLSQFTERLRRHWLTSARAHEDVEVQKDLMRFTVDVTTKLAFGYDLNTLEKVEDPLQKHIAHIFPLLGRRVTAPFPYWRYFKPKRDRDADQAMGEIQKIVGRFIDEVRDRMKRSADLEGKPANLLEALMVSHLASDGFTDVEIIGNVLTILLAGADTTANSIAWMLFLVSQHPEVQAQVQAEVDSLWPEKSLPAAFEEMGKMPYVEAVAMETLRLKPVGPLIFFEANVDTEIQGIRLPKGTQVITLTGYVGTQESAFSHAKEFRPERWLPGHSGFPNHNPRALLAFGEGPRFCAGRALAILEMKMVLAMAAANFHLRPPANAKVADDEFKFVVAPKDLWIGFQPRNNPELGSVPQTSSIRA